MSKSRQASKKSGLNLKKTFKNLRCTLTRLSKIASVKKILGGFTYSEGDHENTKKSRKSRKTPKSRKRKAN